MTEENNQDKKYENPLSLKATFKRSLKAFGVIIPSFALVTYLWLSMGYDTFNCTRWPEIYKQAIEKQKQKENTLKQKETDLYFKLYNLIDKNNESGIEVKELKGYLERTIETSEGTDDSQRRSRVKVLEKIVKTLENKENKGEQ